jgi:hypothetical protein
MQRRECLVLPTAAATVRDILGLNLWLNGEQGEGVV